MKVSVSLISLLYVAIVLTKPSNSLRVQELVLETSDGEFQAWKDRHAKMYSDEQEESYRRAIWETTVRLVNEHNAKSDQKYELEVNHFADQTHEEWKEKYLMVGAPQPGCSATLDGWKPSQHQLESRPRRKTVDWREKGIVSPVKNQGHCGSCWTFSTTGCLEAHFALYHDVELNLSEQQLVDCARDFDNHGCQGGLPSHAFEYIKYNGGLETEAEYAYKGKNGKCKFDPKSKVLAKVIDSNNITAFDEDALTAAIDLHGPVSVAFHVASDFRLYKRGVYDSSKCPDQPGQVNHAVLAVGYGEEDGVPYYIVKNSWTANWGDKGYFKIRRGVNRCGISDCASFPTV